MKELFRRLAQRPMLTMEIVLASLFVNILTLASPIFVMLVLNRYVNYGFDDTLITLTVGVLIAGFLDFGFIVARNRLASAVSARPDWNLAQNALAALLRVKSSVLERMPQAKIQEILAGLHAIQPAYGAQSVTAVLDMPFFILFVGAIFLLSPLLAVVTLLAMAATLLNGLVSMRSGQARFKVLQELSAQHRGLMANAVYGADTVRAFQAGGFLKRAWDGQVARLTALRLGLAQGQNLSKSVFGGLALLLRVGVYSLGAMQVVRGELNTGALIAVSIMATKAIQLSASFMQQSFVLAKAQEQLDELRRFVSMPMESGSGTAMNAYSGRLEFRDVGFAYPGAPGPLFESLNLVLEPGTILCVQGYNGSGKTTLARLVAGLIEPGRGQILADGVDLRQIASEWWRRQLVYVPQEPVFINATVRENILMANPDLDAEGLNAVIRAAGLKRFLDQNPQGLEMELAEGGRILSTGIRRRLALARGLATGGSLAVMDEPVEGMDAEGRAAVYNVLNSLAKRGATLVIISHDPNIIKASKMVLDLGRKPVPALHVPKPGKTGAAQ